MELKPEFKDCLTSSDLEFRLRKRFAFFAAMALFVEATLGSVPDEIIKIKADVPIPDGWVDSSLMDDVKKAQKHMMWGSAPKDT